LTTHPEIAKQWHPTLNGELRPDEITSGSGRKVWWLCSQGHSHQDSPNHKKAGRGCPVCSNKIIIPGINDLAFLYPTIANQWHPTRNEPLEPDGVSPGSNRKAWWLCGKGHQWQSVIATRLRSSGCPVCSNKTLVKGVNDLATTDPFLASQWHPTLNSPVKPEEVFAGTLAKYWWLCDRGHEWRAAGSERSAGKGCPICSGQRLAKGVNDLQTTHPEIASQWHPTKNGDARPENFVAGGKKQFWWFCSKGHEWLSTISNRKSGRGCPSCHPEFVYKGTNLLVDVNPLLASQWHPSLNDSPVNFIAAGSKRKDWWVCEKGHQWRAVVGSRQGGNGCPYCSNTLVLPGVNDLATTSPGLAREWNVPKNLPLRPTELSIGSNKLVWWTCKKGHDWKSSPHNRSKGQGCAVCVNKQLTRGVNDLATTHPGLAEQWHAVRNLPEQPHDVIAGSAKKFWWVCEEGHEWRATGNSRLRGSGCPACSASSFDSTKAATLYFIQNDKALARKVGITNKDARTDRLAGFKKLGWTVIRTFESNPGLQVQTTEQLFFRWLRKEIGLPAYLGSEEMGFMGGWSETFSLDGPTNEVIVAKLESLLQIAASKDGTPISS